MKAEKPQMRDIDKYWFMVIDAAKKFGADTMRYNRKGGIVFYKRDNK